MLCVIAMWTHHLDVSTVVVAYLSYETLGAAEAGNGADAHLRETEARLLASEDHVERER